MALSKGEEILATKLSEAHSETTPNASAIDPTMIITIIGMILDFIKGCRNPQTAGARIKQGGALSFAAVRKALKAGGYQGDIRGTARAMTRKGETCTQEELDAVLADAAEVPVPPSSDGPWPMVVALVCVLGFGSMANASDGPWPQVAQDVTAIRASVTTLGSDVSAMASRLDCMEDKIDKLLAASTRPVIIAPEPPAEPTLAPPPKVAAVAPAARGMVTFQGKSYNPQQLIAMYPRVSTVEINGNVDAHLRAHGIGGDLSGLSRGTKIKLHSIAHAAGVPARSVAISTSRAVQASGYDCANGNCARAGASYGFSTSGMRQGLFGAWRPIRR